MTRSQSPGGSHEPSTTQHGCQQGIASARFAEVAIAPWTRTARVVIARSSLAYSSLTGIGEHIVAVPLLADATASERLIAAFSTAGPD